MSALMAALTTHWKVVLHGGNFSLQPTLLSGCFPAARGFTSEPTIDPALDVFSTGIIGEQGARGLEGLLPAVGLSILPDQCPPPCSHVSFRCRPPPTAS